jgi:hypothetical protein
VSHQHLFVVVVVVVVFESVWSSLKLAVLLPQPPEYWDSMPSLVDLLDHF